MIRQRNDIVPALPREAGTSHSSEGDEVVAAGDAAGSFLAHDSNFDFAGVSHFANSINHDSTISAILAKFR
jgi:hypothetical protein